LYLNPLKLKKSCPSDRGFFVWGGFGYITSSGNPETLDRSKKTILYSAIGLAVVLGAFVLTNIVSDLATGAFEAAQ